MFSRIRRVLIQRLPMSFALDSGPHQRLIVAKIGADRVHPFLGALKIC